MECQSAGSGKLAERPGQMDLLQHFGLLRRLVFPVYVFV